jgi:MFS family permease
MSAPVGQGLAFMGGGLLLDWLTGSPLLADGLMSGLEPWQAAFIIVGFPGLLLVPVFLLFREPLRQGHGGAIKPTLRETLSVFASRKEALIPMFAAFSMVTLVSYAYFIWTPAMFQRTYDWTAGQVGVGFGMIVIIFGTAGAYFGGWMTDKLSSKGILEAPLKVAAFGFAGCGIFGVTATLMPSAELCLVFLAPAIFLSNTPYACAGTSIQLIIPNRYSTVLTLVGLVIGPMIVGLVTDYIFQDPADIRYSLAIVVGLPAPIMFFLLSTAFAPYRELRSAGQ